MTANYAMIGDFDRDAAEALECIRDGDLDEARDIIAAYVREYSIAGEIVDKIDAGRVDEAALALELFTRPKFKNPSDCAEHVGNQGHYHATDDLSE